MSRRFSKKARLRELCHALTAGVLVVGLAACGHSMEQRAATGAMAGLVVGGPVGAAAGAAVGAAVSKSKGE